MRFDHDHPVQTATAISKATGIDRGTLHRAGSAGKMGNAAYKSEDIWLFDTSHDDFKAWLEAHWQHHKSKKATQQQS